MRPGGIFAFALCLWAGAGTADPAQDAFDAGRPAEAAELWRRAADAGDANAALLLAQMFDTANGIPRDLARALFWYTRAADAGLADAAFNAAAILDQRGRTAEAAVQYARAAAAGHHRAQFALGTLYEAGEGVTRNPQAARHWFKAASAVIPRAADRAAAVEDSAAAGGQPPVAVDVSQSADAVTLVWDAGADPSNRPFRVSLFGSGGDLTTVETRVTAIRIPTTEGADPQRWRVARAGDTSAWHPLQTAPELPTIRILYAQDDAPARRLADELSEALDGIGRVTRSVARDDFPETAVLAASDDQRELAISIATFLPALSAADVAIVDTLRTEIVVAIAGGGATTPLPAENQPMVQK